MSESRPYISVVVTARNDDHGGSLLRRMQAFVNGWIGQCKRHGLSAELIVVDWNPPEDRPPLIDVLRWPEECGPCAVRFIRVPREIHGRYKHAELMPLYQMIAKNVGIRRAQGQYVLATNIDIIFSDELVRYLAEEPLDPDRMYRIDRHDVMSDVPVDGTVDEQLAYCSTHLIRVNAREGTFNLTADGLRALSERDIASSDSGISFGAGWHSVEWSSQEAFRWIDNDAEVTVRSRRLATSLTFDLEPGPSAGDEPLRLKAIEDSGAVLANAEVRRRTRVVVDLPSSGSTPCSFRIHLTGGGLAVPDDPRTLNLRVFRCDWDSPSQATCKSLAPASRPIRPWGPWRRLMHLVARLDQEEPLHLTLAVPRPIRRLAGFYISAGGFTGLLRHGIAHRYPARQEALHDSPRQAVATPEARPVFLHTNACGDFTLMAREHWMDLRGYPEFDMYSFNIDSVLCYAAHHGGAREEVLKDPLRIFHIEHGTGSGWTPEGQARLFDRLRANGISWLEYRELVAWAAQMKRLNSPIIFNRENWGLKELDLPEMVPHAKSCARPGLLGSPTIASGAR
jgi:hypothetical protein